MRSPRTWIVARCLSLVLPALTGALPTDQIPLAANEPLFQPYSLTSAHGAVSSESMTCSEIGISLLKKGGNAVDALIGTTLCVGVIGMYHSGIGGGGFMLVRTPDGDYESVDFRETAPANAWEGMYEGNLEGSVIGGLSVGVPGEIRGFQYIHDKWGKLPWATLFEKAAKVARDGFQVNEDLVRYMNYSIRGGANFLVEDPVWAEDFAPSGRLLRLGETIRRRRYADTLQRIGQLGPNSFYEGVLAKSIIASIQATNGTMTLRDLADYHVISRPAANITYRGLHLFATRSPSSGAVTLSTLKTMEQYPLSDWEEDENLTTHRFDEAMRFGYGARAELGDPDFVSEAEILEQNMLTEQAARNTKGKIQDDKTQPVRNYSPKGTYTKEGHGTSHVVTMDEDGMAVSLTTTINLLFGSQVMDPESGIILNNEMDDFSIPHTSNSFGFPPSPANFIRPFKRPLSSITPVVAEHPNGTLAFATGAAGGSRIVSSTTQVVWHIVEHGDSLKHALARPRLHDQLMPDVTTFEYNFDNGTVEALKERGHSVVWVREGYSAVQAVSRKWDGGFEAAAEPRQENSGGLVC